MSSREFAPKYERENSKEGWPLIKFPLDKKWRGELFPELRLADHPAKANMYLVEACIDYVSEPGETVLDIMSGTGTIMIAALKGRKVVMIEIEKKFQDLIESEIECLELSSPEVGKNCTLIRGDCFKILPIPGL